jgi:hypothetical protein
MTKITTPWLIVFVALVSSSSLLAHHSLANFDTTKAVHVKGTIFQFHQMNPHSFIFLDEKNADGTTRRWAIEGPPVLQLIRSGFAKDGLKAGDIIEVCGYLPKEPIVWQLGSTDPSVTSPSGRLFNAEMMVMSDGKQRSWGDYGVHKCFAPEYTDQHSRK